MLNGVIHFLFVLVAFWGMSVAALGAADNLGYSPDGGLVSFGEFDYVYDSARGPRVRPL